MNIKHAIVFSWFVVFTFGFMAGGWYVGFLQDVPLNRSQAAVDADWIRGFCYAAATPLSKRPNLANAGVDDYCDRNAHP
jgi:hypothetical protein